MTGRTVPERHFQRHAACSRPEQTPAVRLKTPAATKHLFKQDFYLSGCQDLDPGPSIPQITEIYPGCSPERSNFAAVSRRANSGTSILDLIQ